MSWLSYCFIEQKTTEALKTRHGKQVTYLFTTIAFVLLNIFAGWIYIRAGVVRDIPELYISKNNIHRGMHGEYVDRGYQYDKPFSTDKKHLYVIGNSIARDFINIILESSFAEGVEISYSTDNNFKKEDVRFHDADYVFLSRSSLTEDLINEVEIMCIRNGFDIHNLIIVGEKNFGVSNGQIYLKRFSKNYYDQYVEVEDYERFVVKNNYFAEKYDERYIDLMKNVTGEGDKVRVFTPDHHFISADCRHLTIGGAKFYADKIDWNFLLK